MNLRELISKIRDKDESEVIEALISAIEFIEEEEDIVDLLVFKWGEPE
jgi:hypothetical protein